MDDRILLGLALDEALERVKRAGESVDVEWTVSPRSKIEKPGPARVVRVKDGKITAAHFPMPLSEAET